MQAVWRLQKTNSRTNRMIVLTANGHSRSSQLSSLSWGVMSLCSSAPAVGWHEQKPEMKRDANYGAEFLNWSACYEN
jgi:hypothetical protein